MKFDYVSLLAKPSSIGDLVTSPLRYAKFYWIQYFVNNNILQNFLINIFKKVHIDINTDINIFKKDTFDKIDETLGKSVSAHRAQGQHP